MMWRKLISLIILAMIAAGTVLAQDAEQKKKDAQAAAEGWLKLVDDGKYGESWKTAAEYFRNAVPQAQWEQQLKAVRSPLGRIISRKLKSATYATYLPGAPDGEYVVLLFETVFEKKQAAFETVTPMLEKDGKWKVSGYYIK